jgi:hypothetical protein
VGVLVLLLAIAAAGYWLNKHQVNIAVLSIGVDFFQVLAIFKNLRIAWPPQILELFRILSAFNLNIEIVAPECLVPNLSYRVKFAFIMLLPLAVGSIFLMAYLLMAFSKSCIQGHREKRKVYSHRPALVSSDDLRSGALAGRDVTLR